MTTQMPMDGGNQAINVLGLNPGKGHQVPFTSSSSNASPQISETISVVSVYSTVDAFIQTGDSDVTCTTSNGHFLPASTILDLGLGGGIAVRDFDKYVCVIGSSSAGTLYISERK
jgi:hypothetical protein